MIDLGNTQKVTDASLLIVFADNTQLTIDGSQIAFSGLSIDSSTTVDGKFTVGAAVTGELSLTLMNDDDSLSSYDFKDAVITVSFIGPDKDDEETLITTQIGIYTVSEYHFSESSIVLTAYDNLSKFDFPCTDLGSLESLTFPITLKNLVKAACTACDVTLVSSINPILNPDYSITQQPEQWSTMTWHDVISCAAQIAGQFAKIDKYGRLYFSWYDIPSSANTYDGGTFNTTTTPYSDGDPLDGGTFAYTDGGTADGGTFGDRADMHIIPAPYALTVDTDDVVITGLQVVLEPSDNIQSDENTTTYTTPLSGVEGYVITISGNPFIQTTANALAVRDFLDDTVVGMLFRPMQATIVEDPTIDAGDFAYVTGHNGNTYQCFISHVRYAINAATTISCDAESTSYSSKNRFTLANMINNNVSRIERTLKSVSTIAGNTNQYFWHTETGTDTGAHITEVTQDEFLENPENGGGNLLARSNGIAIRDGLTELATFATDGIVIGQEDSSRMSAKLNGFSQINSVGMEVVDFNTENSPISEDIYFKMVDRETTTTVQTAYSTVTPTVLFEFSKVLNGIQASSTFYLIWEQYTFYPYGDFSPTGNYTTSDSSFVTNVYTSNNQFLVNAPGENITMSSDVDYSKTVDLTLEVSDGTNTGNICLIFKVDYVASTHALSCSTSIYQTLDAVIMLDSFKMDGWSMHYPAYFKAPSFKMGTANAELGNFSASIGEGLYASSDRQIAIGKYNVEDMDGNYVLIIGNGLTATFPRNALTVDWSGNTRIAGTLTQGSDRRLKEHKEYLTEEDSSEFIRSLKPAHYIKDGEDHVGFYAQDVNESDKWNCMTGEMNGYMTLGYTELIAPLVKYCQMLEQRIAKLEEGK